MAEEMGLTFYQAADEPVAELPEAEPERGPACSSADQVLRQYERAYEFGCGGVIQGSPSAALRAEAAHARAEP